MQAKAITNYTDESFTGYWDKVPYIIPAGATIYLEDWKADHLAKHLIDRELNKKNIPTNDLNARKEIEALIFAEAKEEVKPEEIITKNVEISSKISKETSKKPSKTKKVAEEDEFVDLNN